MPELAPSVFPVWRIAVTAGLGTVLSFLVLLATARWTRVTHGWTEAVILSMVVGLSILAERLSGNTPALNDDPFGAFSPNDWLCPVLTYVFLGLYAAIRPPADSVGWARSRVLLTVVSFVVNVATI